MRFRTAALLTLCLAVLSIYPAISCSSQRPAFADVIERAEAAAVEIQTYRINLDVTHTENGETNQSGGLVEIVLPDRQHAVTQTPTGPEESILIGQIWYNLTTASNNWLARQWPGSSSSLGMVSHIDQISSLIDIVDMTDEKIDGVNCLHYKGSMDQKARIEEQKEALQQMELDTDEQSRALEQMGLWNIDIEFWIGRDDYILRQLKYFQDMVTGEEYTTTVTEGPQSVEAVYRFYDFNEPITIEPPFTMVEGVYLSLNSTSSVGGSNDLEHQRIKYEITVSNQGIQTARDVRVFIDTPATNTGFLTIETEAPRQFIDLAPNSHTSYTASWEYDLTKSSKEELVGLLNQNTIRASWTDESGQPHEQALNAVRN